MRVVLTIFWNMVLVPQVSQQFWAQHQKKNTVRARSLAISNLITVLRRKLTQGHTHRHAHAHTQHGTAHLFRGNFVLQRRERNRRTRALSWQSLLQDSPHTERHTHAHLKTHTHTHGHRDARHTHAQAHKQVYRHRHAHAHCDDPFPMRRSNFFAVFATARSSAPPDRRNGPFRRRCQLLTSGAGTFLRKSLGNRGGVHIVFCPGMAAAWTCGPVLVSVVPIGTGSPELDAVREGRARLQLV